jgi:type II secretory pathway pseudopilin PulG
MAVNHRGFSLVEATIVLAATSILTAALAPSASRAIDRARLARAVDDAEAIKTAIVNFRADAFQGFSTDGTQNGPLLEMLVSDGDTPRTVGVGGDARWADPVDSDGPGIVVDFIERHLVTNDIFALGTQYSTSGGQQWRGAYLNGPVDADPWGNRYAVNVAFLRAPSDTKNDTVVLSAGPDEEIDTAYQQDGMFPGDDDIIVMVLRDRNSSVP